MDNKTEPIRSESNKKFIVPTKTDESSGNIHKAPSTNYIEAPNPYFKSNPEELSVFQGGGISGCPDWQSEVKTAVNSKCPHLVLLNPRRNAFDLKDKSASEKQIIWEHEHLRIASAIMFWFPKETLCPITLYELGAWSMTKKKLFVGTHPEYQRKEDVIVQTRLARPDITVVHSIEEIVAQVNEWYKTQQKVPVSSSEPEKEENEDDEVNIDT